MVMRTMTAGRTAKCVGLTMALGAESYLWTHRLAFMRHGTRSNGFCGRDFQRANVNTLRNTFLGYNEIGKLVFTQF